MLSGHTIRVSGLNHRARTFGTHCVNSLSEGPFMSAPEGLYAG